MYAMSVRQILYQLAMRLYVSQACPEVFLLLLILGRDAAGLLCYNGTLTSLRFGDDPLTCDTCGVPAAELSRLRCSMTVRCEENAMCFVRSWSSRAKHAWLVQRGCYKSESDDPLPRTVKIPTRSMACKRERFRDAEYRVCLCQADWCNSVQSHVYHRWHFASVVVIAISVMLLSSCLLQ